LTTDCLDGRRQITARGNQCGGSTARQQPAVGMMQCRRRGAAVRGFPDPPTTPMTPPPLDARPLVDALAAAGRRLVLAASGGGAGAITRLVSTPGASEVVLEGLVPYARAAVDHLLGGGQESYCSGRTACRLAVAAWQRACRLEEAAGATPDEAARRAVGAAVTAGLRTRHPKRGEHRAIVAVQTREATRLAELVLAKEVRSRAGEESVAADLVLAELAAAAARAYL